MPITIEELSGEEEANLFGADSEILLASNVLNTNSQDYLAKISNAKTDEDAWNLAHEFYYKKVETIAIWQAFIARKGMNDVSKLSTLGTLQKKLQLELEDIFLACCEAGLDNYLREKITFEEKQNKEEMLRLVEENFETVVDNFNKENTKVLQLLNNYLYENYEKSKADPFSKSKYHRILLKFVKIFLNFSEKNNEEAITTLFNSFAPRIKDEFKSLDGENKSKLLVAAIESNNEHILRQVLDIIDFNINLMHVKSAVKGEEKLEILQYKEKWLEKWEEKLESTIPPEMHKILCQYLPKYFDKHSLNSDPVAIEVANKYEKQTLDKFFAAHQTNKNSVAFFKRPFQRSAVKNDWTLSDVLMHALYNGKSHTRSRQVLQELKWLTKDGQIADSAPPTVLAAYDNLAPKLVEKFYALYNEQLASEKKRQDSPDTDSQKWEDINQIITHGQEENNRTRQVLVRLGWMTSEGEVTDVIKDQLYNSDDSYGSYGY
ncbi:MAG: hypothetical protein CMF38_02370 [Legionellaceae bacterium]|nr:hypothetical protein [Legionellaceae bacterium]HCA89673.1 hypothetical protein [Legionellales bacterium]|tara:strand:- start:11 stop:1480 length:1470 start_codon:yes stop_codon:yes gene_type:complete